MTMASAAQRHGAAAYRRWRGLEIRVARIFNTYGPRGRPTDGAAIAHAA
jgi:nucleoside-diphosphate-sugar epimerase